ncbi:MULTISPECIES: hypothetical protein [Paenibacillus]|uniref:Uncharacterized protein n=1 Tax=Paenibacillus validus TaxID=44253 RepID=A0A7X2ZF58_9BACL|nr:MULTISPECIES: hypothetical protein [Paenibacillus]MUG73761.1 hypothetical protein [Paenibacillus validus]
MTHTPIFFQFETNQEAYMALDTLEELGYKVSLHTETKSPVLHVIVDRNDLTSALEVAQAHGGRLLEGQASPSEISTYAMAYDPDGLIPIPAHFVNEVEPDEAEVHLSASAYSNRSSGAYKDEPAKFDPSGEDYDGFDAGIHL